MSRARVFVLCVGALSLWALSPKQTQAQQVDTLQEQNLPTPFGTLPYVLPEGYCLMDGPDGRTLSAALDRVAPPPAHSLQVRFFPCMDRRRTYEDRTWPLDTGTLRLEYYPQESAVPANGQQALLVLHQILLQQAQQSPLAKATLGALLNTPVGMGQSVAGSNALVHDFRPILRQHWDSFMQSALSESQSLRGSDGFPLGRDDHAVWWAGMERAAPDRVLAEVRAYMVLHGLLVSLSLDRVFSGPDTFDDMKGDLLPAVLATDAAQTNPGQRLAELAPGPDNRGDPSIPSR